MKRSFARIAEKNLYLPELVSKLVDKFSEHLVFENDFHAGYVGSETGSYNDDKWTYNPLNRTEEAFNENVRIFGKLAEVAKANNAKMALEGAFGHCMFEPKALKRLVDTIDNGSVYYIVDIYNYLSIDNYMNHTKIFDECLELFKDKIVIFHIKDFVIEDGALKQCCIGKGMMDYDYIMPLIKKNCPNAYLIFEGSKPEDMEFSYKFVKTKLGE